MVVPGRAETVSPDTTLFYSATDSVSAHGLTELTVDGETLRVETSAGPTPDSDWSQALDQRTGDVVLRWTDPIAVVRTVGSALHTADAAGELTAVLDARFFNHP